ncbi:MAG: Crossover junction endodeoxyribonuclease RuvC [Candidatus Pacebacteria bacterium GW2011_GWB1_47_8]|nr:MAG: Crossover junction endodeoxyribonuclease RuvC [Candidatus Pacebacteria bacterium GW2011_GWA1_46_10]KKU84414.1 MAG: Crossover junction endodeoxyribonuclease RuvC [Candidatus Pacebacteria bacterium GW2011_GWB1_47_8]HCR81156.1 crossover junction endodeoxyribonuclease RuvC [Candidatus Paceibacterota bacterium]
MPKKPEVILGIDPGYDRVGWAVGVALRNQWQLIHYGVIQTDRALPLTERYQSLTNQLTTLIKTHSPQIAVIESLFFFKNQKTALKVSEARGVIIKTCLTHNLKIAEFTPLQIKQAVTGYGRADKKSVEKMVRLQLKLTDRKIIDDAIDALAIMLTYRVQNKLLNPKAVA